MGYLNYSVLFLALVFLSTTSRANGLSVNVTINTGRNFTIQGGVQVQCRSASGQTIGAANANISLLCNRGTTVVASGASNSQGQLNVTVNANGGSILSELLGNICVVSARVPIVNCTQLPVSGNVSARLQLVNVAVLVDGSVAANLVAAGFRVSA